jgi:hypothetical protein
MLARVIKIHTPVLPTIFRNTETGPDEPQRNRIQNYDLTGISIATNSRSSNITQILKSTSKRPYELVA